jgi:hypothetical protein
MPALRFPQIPTWPRRHRFLCLLLLCLFYPQALVLMPRHVLLPIPVDLIALAGIVWVLFTARHHTPLARVAAALTVAVTTLNVLAAAWPSFGSSLGFSLARTALLLAFFLAAAVIVLANVLDQERVTTEKVLGGISVYLLLGVIWSMLYVLLLLLQPDAFRGSTLDLPARSAGGFSWYDLELAEFTYFSYVTLSTLGYGDITPVTLPAQMLVWLEALVAQIYLAVLIARLVSLHLLHSNTGTGGPAPLKGAIPTAPPTPTQAADAARRRGRPRRVPSRRPRVRSQA